MPAPAADEAGRLIRKKARPAPTRTRTTGNRSLRITVTNSIVAGVLAGFRPLPRGRLRKGAHDRVEAPLGRFAQPGGVPFKLAHFGRGRPEPQDDSPARWSAPLGNAVEQRRVRSAAVRVEIRELG